MVNILSLAVFNSFNSCYNSITGCRRFFFDYNFL